MSFSADTGMGECLVVGVRSGRGSNRATFVVLNKRPAYPLLGASAAEQIRRLRAAASLRRLEDGPAGGTLLHFGNEVIGQVLDAPLPEASGWNLSRVADLSLAQAAYQLASESRVWLPAMDRSAAIEVPIATLATIATVGPYHADVSGNTSKGGIRGPFDKSPIKRGGAPTYPLLWSHDARVERSMVFEAMDEGIPRRAPTSQEQAVVDLKVNRIWKTASHCHFNRDFQFNSQSTAMQFTTRKTIGGRAWLSIQLESVEQEKALVAWGNTSLGLLLYWWYANKQQYGRGSIGRLTLQTLPVLNVRALDTEQLAEAVRVFDALSLQELLPIHEMDDDPVRRELDERFARSVLRLPEPVLASGGPLDLLRMKLSREPSIRGHKAWVESAMAEEEEEEADEDDE